MFARAASGSATIRLTYECSGVWQQWPQADEKVGSLDVTKPSYHPREDFLVSDSVWNVRFCIKPVLKLSHYRDFIIGS